jgi:hypothetical protein
LKLASFTANGRTSYGAVVDDGIVDLGKRLKHASVLDVLRAGALDEASKAADAKPDIALNDVTRCSARSSSRRKSSASA